jgi:hypothetical protein
VPLSERICSLIREIKNITVTNETQNTASRDWNTDTYVLATRIASTVDSEVFLNKSGKAKYF